MADVYSFGIILWEIASRKPPYAEITNRNELYNKLKEGLRPKIPKDCPLEISKLMRKCWVRNPGVRPSFKEIVKKLESLQNSNLY